MLLHFRQIQAEAPQHLTMVLSYLRENDASIMKTPYDLGKFEDWQLKKINRCRIYLQAITISDISTACGTTINQTRISRLPTRVEFLGYN